MPNNPISDAALAELDRLRDEVRAKIAGKTVAEALLIVGEDATALRQLLRDAESRLAEARKENEFMRLRLAESDKACAYCNLPKAEMGRCESGFPGCARADDLLHCDELTRRDAQQRRDGAAEWLEKYLARMDEKREWPTLREALDEMHEAAQRLLDGGE